MWNNIAQNVIVSALKSVYSTKGLDQVALMVHNPIPLPSAPALVVALPKLSSLDPPRL